MAEEEKKGGPLLQKFILGKDGFPTYTCLKMCASATLPQGSAACAARRLRLFPRLERGVKSAKMLLIQSSILMANIPPLPAPLYILVNFLTACAARRLRHCTPQSVLTLTPMKMLSAGTPRCGTLRGPRLNPTENTFGGDPGLFANIPPPSACPPPRSLFRRASRSLRIPPPTIRFTPLNSVIAL